MRRALITLLLVGAGVAVAFVLNRGASRSLQPSEQSPGTERDADPLSSLRPTSPVSPPVRAAPDGGVEESDPVPYYFDLAELDFEAIRERTPDSLYWLMAAPTDDPQVLQARAQAREDRNRQYGKVVSNTATVEEIHDYYAYRRKLSEDYIEVLQLILDQHGGELSERDAGLFDLTISMHSARLAEIPSKLDDALQRKAEYDRVKQAWQEQKTKEAAEPPRRP